MICFFFFQALGEERSIILPLLLRLFRLQLLYLLLLLLLPKEKKPQQALTPLPSPLPLPQPLPKLLPLLPHQLTQRASSSRGPLPHHHLLLAYSRQ